MNQYPRDELALRHLETEMEAGSIHVYRNLLGEPYVFFDVGKPGDGTHPGLHRQLFHPDVRGWLTQFIWATKGVLLHDRELDRVLQALSGFSFGNRVEKATDHVLLQILETEPVVAVVVEFMHAEKQKRFERTMDSLWKTLHEFARSRGLLSRGKKRFPAGANVLSRRLGEFTGVLGKLGITVTITRSNGSKVVLERLDDSASQPSVQPPAQNSTTPQELPSTDAKHRMLASLAEKRRHQSDPPPSTEEQ